MFLSHIQRIHYVCALIAAFYPTLSSRQTDVAPKNILDKFTPVDAAPHHTFPTKFFTKPTQKANATPHQKTNQEVYRTLDDLNTKMAKAARETLKDDNRATCLNQRDAYGYTVLHEAVQHYKTNAIKTLIESGANPHTQDIEGWRAIDWAALLRADDIFAILLEYEDKKTPHAQNGKTPHEIRSDVDELERLINTLSVPKLASKRLFQGKKAVEEYLEKNVFHGYTYIEKTLARAANPNALLDVFRNFSIKNKTVRNKMIENMKKRNGR